MEFLRNESIACLRQWLGEAGRCVVVSHTHPDGDALGSSSALALHLQRLGKEVSLLLPDTPADNLRFILPEGLPCHCCDAEPSLCRESIQAADLIILADANAFSRTEGLEAPLKASSARKILMDHHLHPDTEAFGLVFSTPDISSASELVYWILKALPAATDGAIGTALMTGMTTDTNNFANSVYPSTLQMASELLAAGVDRDEILRQVYQNFRENRVRLMGYMQHEGMQVLPNGTAYMILTKALQRRFDLREGESEGLVNVPLFIGHVRLSVLLKEDGGLFRVSVRSKKGTSAQQLAASCFHGGGHENAAGGKLFIGEDIAAPEDAPAYVEKVLKTFLPA